MWPSWWVPHVQQVKFLTSVCAPVCARFNLRRYRTIKFQMGTTLLESLRSQKTHFRGRFRQTSCKDIVFARGEFLSVVRAKNESLRIILMYYMFKYLFGITTTLLE